MKEEGMRILCLFNSINTWTDCYSSRQTLSAVVVVIIVFSCDLTLKSLHWNRTESWNFWNSVTLLNSQPNPVTLKDSTVYNAFVFWATHFSKHKMLTASQKGYFMHTGLPFVSHRVMTGKLNELAVWKVVCQCVTSKHRGFLTLVC